MKILCPRHCSYNPLPPHTKAKFRYIQAFIGLEDFEDKSSKRGLSQAFSGICTCDLPGKKNCSNAGGEHGSSSTKNSFSAEDGGVFVWSTEMFCEDNKTNTSTISIKTRRTRRNIHESIEFQNAKTWTNDKKKTTSIQFPYSTQKGKKLKPFFNEVGIIPTTTNLLPCKQGHLQRLSFRLQRRGYALNAGRQEALGHCIQEFQTPSLLVRLLHRVSSLRKLQMPNIYSMLRKDSYSDWDSEGLKSEFHGLGSVPFHDIILHTLHIPSKQSGKTLHTVEQTKNN